MKNPQTGLEVKDLAYVISRELDAPVELVYRMWVEPEHFMRWWGPHTFTNTVASDGVRSGGSLRVTMRSPEGEEYKMNCTILELVHNERIVLELDLSEHPASWIGLYNRTRGLGEGASLSSVLTIVTLEALGQARCRMHVEQRFVSALDKQAFLDLGTVTGWSESFAKLDGLVASLATDNMIILERTLRAPLALVWEVWSNVEHIVHWWGPNGFKNTTLRFEFWPGGEWHHIMHGPDGTDYPNYTKFIAIEPMRRISYTLGSTPDDSNRFLGELIFEEVDAGRTYVRLSVAVDPSARPHFFGFGAFEGGDQNLSRLEAYANGLGKK